MSDGNLRRSGLPIPQAKLAQINAGRIRHRRREIITGHRLPVMTFEIKVHAFTEIFRTQQAMDHANDFRALFIDRDRIEIIDLNIAIGPDGVGHGAAILGKLMLAQYPHIFDTLHRP